MIHKYKLYDTNIVLDVNSGAVHVFDQAAYDIIDYYKKENVDDIKKRFSSVYNLSVVEEALKEIEELEKQGLLFTDDIYEQNVPLMNRKPVVKALCLHVAHDCNMRCKYCFASTGDFGIKRALMDPEIGKKAIDFIINASGSRRNLEIDFFGGEPLLNMKTVKEIVSYAREKEKKYNKKFRFTITTNALLLNDENIDYINKNMNNVVLSIDGRKEINDLMRIKVDGSGTYDSIIEKIKKIAESRNQDNYYVRGTFTHKNLDFSEDVMHLANEGFKQISVEPVVAQDGSGYEIKESDLDILFKEYEKLALEYVNRRKEGKGFNFFHYMIDLEQGPCVIKRLTGCGSGFEYLAVSPEGDLYPCHQFVGMEDFKIGNVATLEDKGLNLEIQSQFINSNIYTKDECRKCWAKFYCSGGCAANAYQFNKDINIPYKIGCELERKRVECAIWIKTQEML
ncbi:MAG TPA: thioether cross-link-forming SCIFF peptide maturase [Clostridiaceae bacterium]|nr:thioether cross-link-forming SCIFF peptide maturase [Clostridiaceae bacterium]